MHVLEYYQVQDIPTKFRQSDAVDKAADVLAMSGAYDMTTAMSFGVLASHVGVDRSNLLKLLEKRPGFVKVRELKHNGAKDAIGKRRNVMHNRPVHFYLLREIRNDAVQQDQSYPTSMLPALVRNRPLPKVVTMDADYNDTEVNTNEAVEKVTAEKVTKAVSLTKPNVKPVVVVPRKTGPDFSVETKLRYWEPNELTQTIAVPVYQATGLLNLTNVLSEIKAHIDRIEKGDGDAYKLFKALSVITASVVHGNIDKEKK